MFVCSSFLWNKNFMYISISFFPVWLFFIWSIVDLQCGDNYCFTTKWFIYTHICVISEKAMAIHSSTLAWKIPWMEETGRLQSMGSLRVGHNRAASLSLFTFMRRRRKWQPTPVFLPGESHGQRSLVGCTPWGCKEMSITECVHTHTHTHTHTHIECNVTILNLPWTIVWIND